MDIASELCEELFSWLKQRKLCKQQLMALARKLENLREEMNKGQVVTNSFQVAGGTALVGAGILTLCTGGAAAPFLALLGGASVISATTVDVFLKLAETWSSSSTMKTAKGIIQKDEEIGRNIQRLQERLLETCGGQARGASSSDGKHEAAVYMLKAIGIQSGIQLQDALYQNLIFVVGSAAADGVKKSLLAPATLTNIALTLTMAVITDIGFIGLKSAAKGSAKVVANCTAQALGGALGLAISLPELIKNCNEMVGNNHVTEASQALREAAQAIEQARQELKTKLDAIQKKLRDIARVRDHLRNLGPYKSSISESDEEIVNYAMDNCNSDVKQWLQGQFQQAMFLNLFRFFMNDLLNTLKEKEEEIQRKARNEHIHLVFVAHGNITSNFLPACYLMPFQSIKDVILYSPWNCAIDAKAAYGIATGSIKPNQRVFHNYNRNHIPRDLPQSWNYMRSAGSDKIPKILLNAVGSDEGVWCKFISLKNSHKLEVKDRIILPYLVPPGVSKNLFPEVPFEVITCVVAFIFMFFTRLKVTIHLAACLSSGPEDFVFGQWSGQYAWVYDNTWMTTNYMDFDEDAELYDAFRALFGEVSQHPNRHQSIRSTLRYQRRR